MICIECGKEFLEDWRKDRETRKTECRFCSVACGRKWTAKNKKYGGQPNHPSYLPKDNNVYNCQYCGKEWVGNFSLKLHERQCNKNPNRKIANGRENGEFKVSDETKKKLSEARKKTVEKEKSKGIKYSCPFCNQNFTTKSGLGLHIKYCKENPNAIKRIGHKTSDETKRKLSEFQKKKYAENIGWNNVLGRLKESYAEQYFNDVFSKIENKPQHNLHIDRYWLDYAWEDKKVYFEVDGEQHYTEEGIKHDAEREQLLENIGWHCIKRLRWSEYCSWPQIKKEEYISNLLEEINHV